LGARIWPFRPLQGQVEKTALDQATSAFPNDAVGCLDTAGSPMAMIKDFV
jgi:hypothetical protein